jgi:hypothetical protein
MSTTKPARVSPINAARAQAGEHCKHQLAEIAAAMAARAESGAALAPQFLSLAKLARAAGWTATVAETEIAGLRQAVADIIAAKLEAAGVAGKTAKSQAEAQAKAEARFIGVYASQCRGIIAADESVYNEAVKSGADSALKKLYDKCKSLAKQASADAPAGEVEEVSEPEAPAVQPVATTQAGPLASIAQAIEQLRGTYKKGAVWAKLTELEDAFDELMAAVAADESNKRKVA